MKEIYESLEEWALKNNITSGIIATNGNGFYIKCEDMMSAQMTGLKFIFEKKKPGFKVWSFLSN